MENNELNALERELHTFVASNDQPENTTCMEFYVSADEVQRIIDEVRRLQKLVVDMREGLDDYWVTFDEHKLVALDADEVVRIYYGIPF